MKSTQALASRLLLSAMSPVLVGAAFMMAGCGTPPEKTEKPPIPQTLTEAVTLENWKQVDALLKADNTKIAPDSPEYRALQETLKEFLREQETYGHSDRQADLLAILANRPMEPEVLNDFMTIPNALMAGALLNRFEGTITADSTAADVLKRMFNEMPGTATTFIADKDFDQKALDTLLISSVFYNDQESARALVEKKADPRFSDSLSLLIALSNKRTDAGIVQLLAKAGADVNAREGYFLIQAAQNAEAGDVMPEKLNILVNAGGDVKHALRMASESIGARSTTEAMKAFSTLKRYSETLDEMEKVRAQPLQVPKLAPAP